MLDQHPALEIRECPKYSTTAGTGAIANRETVPFLTDASSLSQLTATDPRQGHTQHVVSVQKQNLVPVAAIYQPKFWFWAGDFDESCFGILCIFGIKSLW